MTSSRLTDLIGLMVASGGVAWVTKFSLVVGAHGDAQLQPMCNALWLVGFMLPIGIALALTLHMAGQASRARQTSAFVLFAATMLFLVGLTLTSGNAFARALLRGAPQLLTAELPLLALGLTGLALAPLFWMERQSIKG